MAKRPGPRNKRSISLKDYLMDEEITERIYEKFDKLKPSERGASSHRSIHSEQDEGNSILMPEQVKAHLDKYVISQESAKKDIAVAVSYHYNRIANSELIKNKNNLLVIGPTGVGKTYMLEKVSEILSVPFIEIDITKYTQTGYVGFNIEEIFKYLLVKTKDNIKEAEKAIIYIDEIDKLCEHRTDGGKDINGYAVQTELLKVLEGTEMPLSVNQGNKIIPINTNNILFVCSGAFPKLEEVINKRLKGTARIGFGGTPSTKTNDADILSKVEVEDFVNYGFLREFIGRLPVRAVLSPLTKEELKRILHEPEDSVTKHYKSELKPFGIEIDFTDEALDLIAERAYNSKLGARSLHTICESTLKEFKYELPGSGIKQLTITKEAVLNPKNELERMLAKK